jgi:hypothetical protein
MEPALVHEKFQIWQIGGLAMDNKRFVVAVVGDVKVLLHILESEDIRDGFFIKPHVGRITLHTRLSLIGHFHGTTIALEAHARFRASDRVDVGTITKQIHRGLAVQ